ncbi:hypothetical protein EX30DRAFT_367487 [Ascodesmis nigricans]|uniref:Uncharacterized protein n=1 Tax=Ascodesmis nigricans TaxID=341454 RepID=A0A4S2MMD9_9PEZI|nr:hypothetical protein EX30DRAFT_367487 [Ascodesmis nigricans]
MAEKSSSYNPFKTRGKPPPTSEPSNSSDAKPSATSNDNKSNPDPDPDANSSAPLNPDSGSKRMSMHFKRWYKKHKGSSSAADTQPEASSNQKTLKKTIKKRSPSPLKSYPWNPDVDDACRQKPALAKPHHGLHDNIRKATDPAQTLKDLEEHERISRPASPIGRTVKFEDQATEEENRGRPEGTSNLNYARKQTPYPTSRGSACPGNGSNITISMAEYEGLKDYKEHKGRAETSTVTAAAFMFTLSQALRDQLPPSFSIGTLRGIDTVLYEIAYGHTTLSSMVESLEGDYGQDVIRES